MLKFRTGMLIAASAAVFVMSEISPVSAASCSNVFYNGRPKDGSVTEVKNHPALKFCCQGIPQAKVTSATQGFAGCVAQPSDCTKMQYAKVVSSDNECDKAFPGYKPSGL